MFVGQLSFRYDNTQLVRIISMSQISLRESKTEKKKNAQAARRLGATLLSLPDLTLKQLQLPENILKAISDAKKISSNSARRRQMQYVARLLRGIDYAAIEKKLKKQNESPNLKKSLGI